DAALHCLMMHAQPLSHGKKRRLLAISEKPLRTLHPARRLGSRARNGQQARNLALIHRQIDRLTPSCHDTTPRSVSNEESTNMLPVPSMPVSWNRSSSCRRRSRLGRALRGSRLRKAEVGWPAGDVDNGLNNIRGG